MQPANHGSLLIQHATLIFIEGAHDADGLLASLPFGHLFYCRLGSRSNPPPSIHGQSAQTGMYGKHFDQGMVIKVRQAAVVPTAVADET
jgi:hypothetical protein